MIRRFVFVLFLLTSDFNKSSAFWSLDTDLQFGYEIYDRSYEINAAVQGIITASTRSNVIQTDSATRAALAALSTIGNQLRSAPITFFGELAYAASSRINNEAWHITRLRSYHRTYMNQLEVLANSTGSIEALSAITNPSIMQTIRNSFARIQHHSNNILIGAEQITLNVGQARANSSLLLTPQLLNDFIESDTASLLKSSLVQVRNSYLLLLSSIRDTARLTAAYGSMYDILERSNTRDIKTRNTSLYNFANSYNRVRNTLLTSVVAYRQTAHTGFANFIQRVQSSYDDTIVRPRFDSQQLPLILAFANVVTTQVYNQTFFEISFDSMRDAIVELYSNETSNVFIRDSQYRDIILDLLRESFARRYATCLNELVSEAQEGLNLLTGKYSFCLDERTSGITIVIPSTSSWLSVIRDNVNSILQQLNACLNGLNSVAGRRATSDCIQSNANNLQFYAMYLPLTVQTNLRPIVQSPPLIFKNCIGVISASFDEDKFGAVYEKCRSEGTPIETTTTTTLPSTTTTPLPIEETTEEEETVTDEETTTEVEEIDTTPEESTTEESEQPTEDNSETPTEKADETEIPTEPAAEV